jgi:hypothetical protein
MRGVDFEFELNLSAPFTFQEDSLAPLFAVGFLRWAHLHYGGSGNGLCQLISRV